MSDELKIKVELPEALEEPAKALSMPLATNVGTTIGDLWFLVLGSVSQKAALKRVKYAHDLEKYKNELEKELNEIPEEQRIEPNTQVVMNALTASQSCIEEESLRSMFAKLIASACDSKKADNVHPAFPEMIKQMSTVDAEIFLLLGQRKRHPIVNVRVLVEGGGLTVARNIFIEDTSRYSLTVQCSAIDCLSMLGLIDVTFMTSFVKKERYEPFKSLPIYRDIDHTKQYEYVPGMIETVKGVDLEEGQIGLSAFGWRFFEACT